MLATGGTAAIAAPVIPTDFAASAAGTIVTEVADWAVFDTTADKLAQSHDSKTLTTTGTKELCITLKHKITPHDAQIGFYRSGLHAYVPENFTELPDVNGLFTQGQVLDVQRQGVLGGGERVVLPISFCQQSATSYSKDYAA
jgi:hypothetical protein